MKPAPRNTWPGRWAGAVVGLLTLLVAVLLLMMHRLPGWSMSLWAAASSASPARPGRSGTVAGWSVLGQGALILLVCWGVLTFGLVLLIGWLETRSEQIASS